MFCDAAGAEVMFHDHIHAQYAHVCKNQTIDSVCFEEDSSVYVSCWQLVVVDFWSLISQKTLNAYVFKNIAFFCRHKNGKYAVHCTV